MTVQVRRTVRRGEAIPPRHCVVLLVLACLFAAAPASAGTGAVSLPPLCGKNAALGSGSVAAHAEVPAGGSVSCRREFYCPERLVVRGRRGDVSAGVVSACTVSLFGQVSEVPVSIASIGTVSRDVSGTGQLATASLLGRSFANSLGPPDYCRPGPGGQACNIVTGQEEVSPGDTVYGICTATAGAWNDPSVPGSRPGPVSVDTCSLNYSAQYHFRSRRCSGRVRKVAARRVGMARARCRVYRKRGWIPATPPTRTLPQVPPEPGGPGFYRLTVTGEGVFYTAPDGRHLGAGSGLITVTLPSGATQQLGCAQTCTPGRGSWVLPADSTVSITASENRDSIFGGFALSGATGCSGSSRSCQLTLSADTTVAVKFAVRTWVLKVSNANLNEGGAYQGAAASGIDCGLNEPTGVVTSCSAIERAYTQDLRLTVYAGRPAHDGKLYVYDTLDCGSGPPQDVEPNHITAQCDYSNTASDTTLSVSWMLDPRAP